MVPNSDRVLAAEYLQVPNALAVTAGVVPPAAKTAPQPAATKYQSNCFNEGETRFVKSPGETKHR